MSGDELPPVDVSVVAEDLRSHSPTSFYSDFISDIEDDLPAWLDCSVEYHIRLVKPNSEGLKEVRYTFGKGENVMSVGNLVAKIKEILGIKLIGSYRYSIKGEEIIFSEKLMYQRLREWLRFRICTVDSCHDRYQVLIQYRDGTDDNDGATTTYRLGHEIDPHVAVLPMEADASDSRD